MTNAGVRAALVAAFVLVAGTAAAQCSISGEITARPSGDPLLSAWEYTLVVTWDTGSPSALGHADLPIDPVGRTCACGDVAAALTLVDPAGTSDGVGGCTVPYVPYPECAGDPSIPGVTGILLEFEPDESLGCEPGPTGTATFVFYSDHDPVPVDEDILSIVDKHGLSCAFEIVSRPWAVDSCTVNIS